MPPTTEHIASRADDSTVLVPALTHTTQFLAHFSAIVRQPQEVALRAGLADWLEANGDPLWAELIRTQLALDRSAPLPDESNALVARMRELLDRVGQRIRAFGREVARGFGLSHVDLAGGLPGHVFADPAALTRSAAEIADALPVTAVNLTAWPGGSDRRTSLSVLRHFGALTELAISPAFGPNDRHATAAGLAEIGTLGALRSLTLSGAMITDAGVRHLAGLTALRFLNVSANRLTDDTTHALRPLTRLKALDLSYNPVTDIGVARLVSLADLEWVNLRGTDITQASGPVLARLPNLKRVLVGDSAALASFARPLGSRVRL